MAVIFFGYQKLNEFFNRGGTIIVPDFRGMHIVEVFRTKPAGLDIVRRDEKHDADHERDHVIAQYPEPGTVVRPGKNVLLSISLGMQTVNVPDLKNSSMREVNLALMNSQLAAGNTAYMYSSNIAHDRIINQSPLANEEFGVNRDVDLLMSLGPRPETGFLPNLFGLSLDQAREKIRQLELNSGRIFSKTAPGVPRFQVLSTNPPPFTPIRKGQVISILISAGDDHGTATEADLQRFLLHPGATGSVYTVSERSTSQVRDHEPPRIMLHDDEPRVSIDDQNEDDFSDKSFVEVSYVMPDGFMPKEVKFIHITQDGRNQIYVETHNPLDLIKVEVPAVENSRVQIYLNDIPVTEKRITQ